MDSSAGPQGHKAASIGQAPGHGIATGRRWRGGAALMFALATLVALPLLSYENERAQAQVQVESEREAVALIRDALALMDALQLHRRLALDAAAGRGDAELRDASRGRLDAAWRRLQATQARLGDRLGTATAFDALTVRLATALPAADAQASVVLAAYAEPIRSVAVLLSASVDGAGRLASMSTETRHALDQAARATPSLLEAVALLRDDPAATQAPDGPAGRVRADRLALLQARRAATAAAATATDAERALHDALDAYLQAQPSPGGAHAQSLLTAIQAATRHGLDGVDARLRDRLLRIDQAQILGSPSAPAEAVVSSAS